MAAKILLVEDDPQVRGPVKEVLAAGGLRVLEAETVQLGLHLFRTQAPDLVILDVHLPDGTGFSVCEAIRKSRCAPATPVIMLTAASKLEEKERGFSAGADHYLVKPVHPKELLMWVSALLKRLELDQEPRRTLAAEDLLIELDAQLVRFKGVEISGLTGKEFDLLYFLARSRPKILSRKYILSNLWHTITVDHVVDTHISNLRKKVPPELSDRIQSIPGKGFRYLG
ncbi:MAG: hypothetical protein A2X36_03110 [Elusimicrobia bacterium GWA2_69_24]|nr:MAG: hypothetical protein A2X36_03110 [Elusimicrobia bacterium GWA2_69_24]HBL19222.1 DNA-binding response regulator [Elusimicrobiota bacterium]